MKHNIISVRGWLGATLLVLALSPITLYAQSSPNLWLGLHGGVDIGTFSEDPTDPGTTNGSTTGLAIGGELDYFFSDNLGICVQAAFDQKGGSQTTTETIFGTTINFSDVLTYSYLQIPVLLKATFGSGQIKPVVFAGPEFGIKLSAKARIKSAGVDSTITAADSEAPALNLGIMFGAGVTYAVNPTTQLYFTAAYDLGLTDLNTQYGKKNSDGTTDNQIIKSRDIRLSVGVLFGLGNSGASGETPPR